LTVNGILPLLKPGGMTSHDVVAFIRKTLRMRRVGHTGTLDPDATGVLVILLGKATRLMQFMVTLPKTYVAEVVIGIATDTLDASGQVVSRTEGIEIPKERFLKALSDFQGEIWQIPPMVSAVHHKGRRLYELARAGVEAEREPRRVYIHRLSIQAWPEHEVLTLGDRVSILVECSSGTYGNTFRKSNQTLLLRLAPSPDRSISDRLFDSLSATALSTSNNRLSARFS
jgi:tRNA pseudouridine55 synthase